MIDVGFHMLEACGLMIADWLMITDTPLIDAAELSDGLERRNADVIDMEAWRARGILRERSVNTQGGISET